MKLTTTYPAAIGGRHALTRTLLLCLLGGSVHATDFLVSTAVDESFDGGSLTAETIDGAGLSLREAIGLANANGGAPGSGEGDGDTIAFDPFVFLLSTPQIELGSELVISDDLTIDGSIPLGRSTPLGQALLDGGSATRLIRIETAGAPGSGAVALENLQLIGGAHAERGGAILIEAGSEVSLAQLSVANCSAADGGAVFNDGGSLSDLGSVFEDNAATGESGSGGAIFNNTGGSLALTGTSFSGNRANRAGGAIEDQSGGSEGFDLVLENVDFTANNAGVAPASAAPGNGGAIHISGSGSASITGGSAEANLAASEGGGFWNSSGTMTIDGTSLDDNIAHGSAADNGGGALFNNGGTMTVLNSTLRGNLADGASGSGGGVFSTDGAVTITDSTLAANVANRAGGAIEVIDGILTLSATTLGGNSAEDGNVAGPDGTANPGNGGGIHISGAAETTLLGGTVSSNLAAREGGGLWNQAGATMTIRAGVELRSNRATGDAADDGGGAIFNNGGILVIDDSDGAVVVADNIADGSAGSGGGLLNVSGGVVTITGATFSGNRSNRAGGAIEDASGTGLGLDLVDTDLIGNITGVAPAVAAPGNGGGIHISGAGDVRVTGGEVTGNLAAAEGGGLWNGTGTMTVAGVLVATNSASGDAADQGGGGIFNAGGNVVIEMETTIDGNIADGSSGSGGGILNDAGGNLSVTGSSILNNRANRAGGGIEDNSGEGLGVTLADTEMNGNNAGAEPAVAAPGNGGALHVSGPGDVSITGGGVSGNVAALEGGGLWNGSGTMTVEGTLVDGNEALGDAADDGGGGLFNNGGSLVVQGGVVISNNIASGASGSGGGILNVTGGTVSIRESEIRANRANRAGGGIEDQSDLTDGIAIELVETVLDSNNAGVDPAVAAPGNGGGLHVTGPGGVSVTGGSVTGNLAAAEGGGLWNGSGAMGVAGVSLSGNLASGNDPDQGGGAIYNLSGMLTVQDSTLMANVADGTAGSGGAVLNDAGGTLIVTDSAFTANLSNRAGGAIEDNSGEGTSVFLTDVEFVENNTGVDPATAAPGNGGALHITGPGSSELLRVQCTGNLAAAEGGGLWNGSGTMLVRASTLSGNVASGADPDQGGGGIFNAGGSVTVETSSVISGNVADGTSGSGGGVLNDGGNLMIRESSISSNLANRAGGAIEVTGGSQSTIEDCTVESNIAGPMDTANPGNGGALHISGDAVVTALRSNFEANEAANEGGGLWNSGAGTLVVDACAVIRSSAPDGGGIFNQSGGGMTELRNTTVSSNTAASGAGARVEGGNLSLLHVTLAGNTAGTSAGGIEAAGGTVSLVNSLLADNTSPDGSDLLGPGVTASFSLVENADASTGLSDGIDGNRIGADPQLAALADNGGPTRTMRPMSTSPVIDAGNSGAPGIGDFDQRGPGFDRLIGSSVDMGAVEVIVLGYAAWAMNHLSGVAADGPDEDPDADQIPNAIEWLTGSDPLEAGANPVTGQFQDGQLVLSFPRNKLVPNDAEVLEVSETLTNWRPAAGEMRSAMSIDAGTERVRLTLPAGAGPRFFARLNVALD